ncbi:MAG: T9SS type A sorting domain-containing protein [bacterium]|nr:T9SS type A sorting domain-containing protein [bacterium]
MKKRFTLLALCGLLATGASAQIIQSVNPDTPIWGVTNNTGIAIAPDYHWNAIVYDDPAGDYWIQWRDAATAALLDIDNQPGANPDVAYYGNADALVVAYENGGGIFVDDYYLNTVVPVDYVLNMNTGIAGGINPNVDMSSQGDGVLTWEDGGGTVFACAFQIGPFAAGPIVPMAPGTMPDVALMDNSKELVLTYEQGGQLIIETYDYMTLQAGGAAPTSPPVNIATNGIGWEWPRVQANRNQLFGGPDLYTVVAQDNMGGGLYDVFGHFFIGSGNLVANPLVNVPMNGCAPSFPRPVVAYDRDEVHIAFSVDHTCAFPPTDPSSQDILMVHYDHGGGNMPLTPPGVFLEVNQFDLPFANSATSLNTEYDGFFMINNTNYCEGTAFNDPGDLFWKVRDPAVPAWRQAEPSKFTVEIEKGVMSNFITVDVTTLDESVTENDIEMEFAVYDQSGRLIEVPSFEQNGMSFQIDVTNLEQGIYLLQYTLNGETQAERIPHFTN